MVTSVREVRTIMDPSYPASSVRNLYERFRWTGQSKDISVASILRRMSSPSLTSHKVLSYNTFLLPGIDIPFSIGETLAAIGVSAVKAIFDLQFKIADIVAKFGLDALGYLDEHFGVTAVADNLGINKIALEAIVASINPIAILGLVSDRAIIEALLSFANVSATDELARLLGSLETGLATLIDWMAMDAITVLVGLGVTEAVIVLHYLGIDLDFHPGAKKALEERASGIGVACMVRGYDVMAFSEVWDWDDELGGKDQARVRILGAWAGAGIPVNSVSGSELEAKVASSLIDNGLFRVTSAGRDFVEPARFQRFTHQGNKLFDTDAWSNKGILLTRIRCGAGIIDVYNTHLISGGDLAIGQKIADLFPTEPFINELNEDGLQAKRMTQLGELRDFFNLTHRPENVAIICGDFNIGASYEPYYRQVQELMATMSMRDVFQYQTETFRPQPTDRVGGTHGPEDGGPGRFDGVCPVDTKRPSDSYGYCDEDSSEAPGNHDRIDYVFLEEPRVEHSFKLDITRLRRTPFFVANLPEGETFLSDHLGLEFTLFTSSRD